MVVTTERHPQGHGDNNFQRVALDRVTGPVKPHLRELEHFMKKQVAEFEPELSDLVAYCLRNSGKRIRPILLFYSGWGERGVVSPDHVKAAAVLEFVHLATLVHDDILDEAKLRHNESTVSEKFGTGVAVLLGDALFSQALKLAAEYPMVDICRAVSKSTRRVCAGEIGQTFQRGNTGISFEKYYRIIELKTAELFSVSCFLGARLAEHPPEFIHAVRRFGKHLGIAYQMYDDLADFVGHEDSIGKTLGTDLASGKFTVPLILLREELSKLGGSGTVEYFKSIDSMQVDDLKQLMAEKGIFAQVRDYFAQEIATAERSISPFSDLGPVTHLLGMSEFVSSQIEKFS